MAIFVVYSHADVGMLRQLEEPVQEVVVYGVDSIDTAFGLFRDLGAATDEGGWICHSLHRLDRLARIGVELSRIATELLPRLQADANDLEAMLLLKNAAWIVRKGAMDFGGVVQQPCVAFANRVIRVIRLLQSGHKDVPWFSARLPQLVVDLHAVRNSFMVPLA